MHPGPERGGMWSLGSINPTGLAGKSSSINELSFGIYGVCETHLTAQGITRFRSELAQTGSRFQFTAGAPAPPKVRSVTSTGGKHTGVGFLSSYPCRPIKVGWNEENWVTGRLHAAQFLVNNTWVTGGVAYGWALNAESQAVREHTNVLLQDLSRQILTQVGPRFICGDFNQNPGKLEEPKVWEKAGWLEIQDWAYQQWQIEPALTCKGTTRKDYIYISPEMQHLLRQVRVYSNIFADHAVLQAAMDNPSEPPVMYLWPKAKPVGLDSDMQQQLANSVREVAETGNATENYTALCQAYEEEVAIALTNLGRPALTKHHTGRGTVMTRKKVVQHLHPCKPARHGEPECQVVSPTLQLKQWFTQLRRLINLHRLITTGASRPSAKQHLHALWRSVLRGKGFSPNFRLWWSTNIFVSDGKADWLPVEVPSATKSAQILEVFQAFYTKHEGQILRNQAEHMNKRHQQDANLIFKVVRDQGPVPVEVLTSTASTTIVEIADEGSVIVESSNGFTDQHPVLGDTQPLPVVMVSEGQLWFGETHKLEVGQTIYQHKPTGRLEEMFEAFGQAWLSRWDKHRNFPADHWDTLLDFIDVALPDFAKLESPNITVSEWQAELRRKPKTAATGMDGVSVQDLLSMPVSLQQQLLTQLARVEETGNWPEQLTHGAVHSLQKVENATSVNQYRPITILPAAYRVWSSIRCKQLLKYLQQFLPEGIYGNAVGKSATAMWYQLQLQVEIHQWEDRPMVGAIADIVKAFNCLPRVPILAAAVKLGVSSNIVKPWTSMLCKLQRHFVIRQSYGPGLCSTTGLAEGCGLSVAGMMITNIIMHRYMQLQTPNITMMSYVDNWELQAESAEEVVASVYHLDRFCTLLDLQLDKDKTVFWSLDGANRKQLRNLQKRVIHQGRDLGGHMQFTKQQTNGTVAEKCAKLSGLWTKLFRCKAPLPHKFKVLRCKAWPRALHASPGVHINPHQFDALRGGAMQGLGLVRAGASSLIQLSLLSYPTHDPECYAAFSSLRHFRRYADAEAVGPFLHFSSQIPERQHMPGPLGVLIARLAKVGWTHQVDGVFTDLDGIPIDIVKSPLQLVCARFARAWQQHVGRSVSSRHGFQGAHQVDASNTVKQCKHLDDEEAGIVRAALNGTFFTEDVLGKIHGNPESAWVCPLCKKPDSIHHRYWECAHTELSRQNIPIDIRDHLQASPEVTRIRGWMTESPHLMDFHKSLLTIPDSTAEFAVGHHVGFRDAFTDGAGIEPQQPAGRLVTWGWVAGDSITGDFIPVASGGLPSLLQTIGRAEIMALISVLKYIALHQCFLRVWIDNQYVFEQAKQIQQKQIEIDLMQPDHDLWQVVEIMMEQIHTLVSLNKVCSHQRHATLTTVEQWVCEGNDSADKQASNALQQLPPEVLSFQRLVAGQLRRDKKAHQHMISHIVQVGKIFTALAKGVHTYEVTPTEQVVAISTEEVVNSVQDRIPGSFQFAGLQQWLQWFQMLTTGSASTTWVSWHELYVMYQMDTGQRGVVCQNITSGNHRQWKLQPGTGDFSFADSSRSFGHFGMQILKIHDTQWKSFQRRPTHWKFQFWCGCLPLKIQTDRLARVHRWFDEQYPGRPFVKMQGVLANLPPVDIPVMPEKGRTGLWKFWG